MTAFYIGQHYLADISLCAANTFSLTQSGRAVLSQNQAPGTDGRAGRYGHKPEEVWRKFTELNMANPAERDPLHHTQKMQKAKVKFKGICEKDIEKVDEPQLRAIFKTSARSIGWLVQSVPRKKARERSGMATII